MKKKTKREKTRKNIIKHKNKASSQSSIVLSGALLLAQTKVTQLKSTTRDDLAKNSRVAAGIYSRGRRLFIMPKKS